MRILPLLSFSLPFEHCMLRECTVGFPLIKDHANVKKGGSSRLVYSYSLHENFNAHAHNVQTEVKLAVQ